MKSAWCAIGVWAAVAGAAAGGGLEPWRDWSTPVKLEGGSPFENTLGVDEQARLARRAEPILEHIGEDALKVRLVESTKPPIAMGGFSGFVRLGRNGEESRSEVAEKKGRDIEQLVRNLGIARSKGNDGGSSMVSSMVLGDDEPEKRNLDWGWLANQIMGENGTMETAVADTGLDEVEGTVEGGKKGPTLADKLSGALDIKGADGTMASAASGAEGDGNGGMPGAASLAGRNQPLEGPGAADVMAAIAQAQEARAGAGGKDGNAGTGASGISGLGVTEAGLGLKPDWDSLLAGGKTVGWREAAGLDSGTSAGSGKVGGGNKVSQAATGGEAAAGWDSGSWGRGGGAVSERNPMGMGMGMGGRDAFSVGWGAASGGGTGLGNNGISFGGGGSGRGGYAGGGYSGMGGGWGSGSGWGSGNSYGGLGGGSGGWGASGGGAYGGYGGYSGTGSAGGSEAGNALKDSMKMPTGGGMKPAWY